VVEPLKSVRLKFFDVDIVESLTRASMSSRDFGDFLSDKT
jgi:hypothetical protein